MTKRFLYVAIAILISIIAISLYCHFDKRRLHVHLSEESPDGSKVAKIAWKWMGTNYTTIQSWLIVEDSKTDSILLKRELLGGKDIPSDITREFRGLSWDGDNIILDVRGRKYTGPVVIELE